MISKGDANEVPEVEVSYYIFVRVKIDFGSIFLEIGKAAVWKIFYKILSKIEKVDVYNLFWHKKKKKWKTKLVAVFVLPNNQYDSKFIHYRITDKFAEKLRLFSKSTHAVVFFLSDRAIEPHAWKSNSSRRPRKRTIL